MTENFFLWKLSIGSILEVYLECAHAQKGFQNQSTKMKITYDNINYKIFCKKYGIFRSME